MNADCDCLLRFDEGTLVLEGSPEAAEAVSDLVRPDPRINAWRAEAYLYESVMRRLYAAGIRPDDRARNYAVFGAPLRTKFKPMPHQSAALSAWLAAKCRGIVAMPTGSGKTFLAFLAIASVRRSTLVVLPTIDLLHQWASQLERAFEVPVGMLGGGSSDVRPITVSTYDSAVLRMPQIGDRFGLAVYDECHHLPGEVNRLSASLCLAPYRLGLSATPDTGDTFPVMCDLLGQVVYRTEIDDLEGRVLSPYRTVRLRLGLTPEEAAEYAAAHEKYVAFIRANGIRFQDGSGWSDFIALCARRPGGREAYKAYLRQRAIARCGSAKLREVWRIVRENPFARTIVFTADNDTAYRIGEALCVPVLTHKTKAAERKDFLEKFRQGDYPVLVTSKVLNEGVDVPEANIGIVVSGSGCTREHVQRLGRILRRVEGKEAVLYELVSDGTSEMNVSDRRRQNSAYSRRRY